MPIYEFRCNKCGNEFEYLCFTSKDSENAVCTSCGSEKTEKMMSACSSMSGSGGDSLGSPASSSCGSHGGFS